MGVKFDLNDLICEKKLWESSVFVWSDYLSYEVASLLEEVGGGGDVERVGEAGEAEPKDEEVQEPEKTFLPCFDTESDW